MIDQERFCCEPVTVSKNGPSHPCRFRARYIVIRKDGDRKRVCKTHANQLVREGWWIDGE